MRFKVDENLPEELTHLLRNEGWDCFSVVEQQLGGEIDPHVVDVCVVEKRILITFDRIFQHQALPARRWSWNHRFSPETAG